MFAAEEKLVVYLTHMVYHVNQGLLALGSYLILLRWKRLAAAAQHVDRFDRLAGDALAHRPCTSQRRIAFGMSAMPVFVSRFDLCVPKLLATFKSLNKNTDRRQRDAQVLGESDGPAVGGHRSRRRRVLSAKPPLFVHAVPLVFLQHRPAGAVCDVAAP